MNIIITSRGNLPCKKFIVHTFSPEKMNKNSWKDAIVQLIHKSEELHLQSISIPAIGTGMPPFHHLCECFWTFSTL